MEQVEGKKLKFLKIREDQAKELIGWWHGLHKRNGPRAALKRCASPEDAALHPDTFSVKSIFPWMSYEAAAAMAGILSHIREVGERVNTGFAVMLAVPSGKGGRAPFSEARFRQLLSSRDWNEFYTRLRRAVKILNGNVNPLSVADIILRWDDEHRSGTRTQYGHSLKFDLSNEYYTQILIKE